MRIQPHCVQLGADNTDVFGGTLGAQVPDWARQLRIQVVFSDSDALHTLTVNRDQVARNSAPHRTQADNVQQIDWNSTHHLIPVVRGGIDFEILLDHNAVTAGFGIACLQWEG